MRLKRVKIFGFKTFAEKTELSLDGDIIAIVGPNGCGKSNIVDAILWGLGEPNARNLRAATSVDVIFNGSPKRKPLGYAEVTLIFDNEDGALPIDAAEVSITRRVTRAGESQFWINRKACRLKDIYDLLADSGLGRAGYAIVGQREIDQALSASADDRRAWIDEAAGVQRFRAKRIESVRRMDAAKEHLSRIEQILSDIDYQREPLREEAELAQKFVILKASLVQLETDLLIKEVCDSAADAEQIAARIQETESALIRQSESEHDLTRRITEAGEAVGELERKLDAVRELRQSHHNLSDRATSNIELTNQRLVALDELDASLETEQNSSEEHVSSAEQDIKSASKEAQKADQSLRELSADRSIAIGNAETLQLELNEIEKLLTERRAEHAEAIKRAAAFEAGKQRFQLIEQEIRGIEKSLAPLEEEVSRARLATSTVQDEFVALEAKVQDLQSKRVVLLEIQEELNRSMSGAKAEISSAEAKARVLQATIDSHEGLSQGSGAVMKLVRDGDLDTKYTPIAEAFSADAPHAVAIETALGGAVHDLIVPSELEAKRAIHLLKERRLGRATFQPLTLVRPQSNPSEIRRLTTEPGVVGIASDLVSCANDHRAIAESLLGRILVVETLEDSLRLAKTRGWSKIVTLDGEVVFSSGAVAGGRTARAPSGIIHRKAELDLVTKSLDGLRLDLVKFESTHKENVEELETLRAQLRIAQAEMAEKASNLSENEKWVRGLQAELDASLRDRDRFKREAASLELTPEEVSFVPEQLDELNAKRDALLSTLSGVRAEVESFTVRLADASRRLEDARSREAKARERILSVDERRAAREARKQEILTERKSCQSKLGEFERERERSQAEVASCEAEITSLMGSRQEALESSYGLSEELKQVQKLIRGLEETRHRLELDRARLESRRTSAVERLLEEYSLTEEDAKTRGPLVDVPADASQIVAKLRRDIRALGDINVGSIEAFERLTQRYSELDLQRTDVQESLDEIQSAVRELDRLTRDKFLTTFGQVREAFRTTFTELFGGGHADLHLTNTDQVLTAGVEVEVTLPGKKRQRLELLSGGERSMSAVAFLFALLKVKPSPLVVLDEVDAPLDGRNVERYVSVLKSCTAQTQFLVITHNPVTIEAAPVWFGVTMQEPGCTSVIPCRLGEESEILNDIVPDALLVH